MLRVSTSISLCFALALVGLRFYAGEAWAQSVEDYLRETPYIGVERDAARPRGADDSTTGQTGLAEQSSLNLTPASANWESVANWQIFTLRNEGGMATSTLSISVTSGFEIQNDCHGRLGGGQDCPIQLRANGTATSGTLTVQAQFGGTAQASLSYTPPAKLQILPRSGNWPEGNSNPQNFWLANSGGQPTGTISVSLSGSMSRFAMNNNCSGTLNSGQSCTITIQPQGTDEGTFSAVLNASHSLGAPGSGDSIPLSATFKASGQCARSSNNFRSRRSCSGLTVSHLYPPLMKRPLNQNQCRDHCDTQEASCCLWLSSGSVNGVRFADGGNSCVGTKGSSRSYSGAIDSALWYALDCN